MIAWAGAERLALGLTDTLDTAPQARWPLGAVAARAPAAPARKPDERRTAS
jgi:N6-L-threonylcarbamoyladenine synthase